ncbi:MAG TPA: class I SAM-dependent methyltransferase [Chloroflexota bacterium]
MKLKETDVQKLEEFLDKIAGDIYPEPPSEPHVSITDQMIDFLADKYLAPHSRILDIGCGQGQALLRFASKGHSPLGINLNQVDLATCRQKGLDVLEMDESFLDLPDEEFDLVWCRHCLEHSVFPYFTLDGFYRVLKSQGHLYVEVPAPDTSSRHQTNRNHYSVLGKSMWLDLMARIGFTLAEQLDLTFTIPAGPDMYWAFILQKPANRPQLDPGDTREADLTLGLAGAVSTSDSN